MAGQSSSAGPWAICWRDLDFEHPCDHCGSQLRPPFVVTGCNHCFCMQHVGNGGDCRCFALPNPRCAKCGEDPAVLTGLNELLRPLVYVRALIIGRLNSLGILWCAAWTIVGFAIMLDAIVTATLLAMLLIFEWSSTRHLELCLVGAARKVGTTTVAHFIESNYPLAPCSRRLLPCSVAVARSSSGHSCGASVTRRLRPSSPTCTACPSRMRSPLTPAIFTPSGLGTTSLRRGHMRPVVMRGYGVPEATPVAPYAKRA